MKERPIIFSGPMVRAILDGRKTQTRRIAKVTSDGCRPGMITPLAGYVPRSIEEHAAYCPHGQPGDRLWVRENGWERPERTAKMMREGADTWARYYYDADGYTDLDREQFREWGFKRRPSIHMPRWASRILLEITGIRLERLQEISEADAVAEGAEPEEFICCNSNKPARHSARSMFVRIWSDIHGNDSVLSGPDAWDANPFVWVIEFQRVQP